MKQRQQVHFKRWIAKWKGVDLLFGICVGFACSTLKLISIMFPQITETKEDFFTALLPLWSCHRALICGRLHSSVTHFPSPLLNPVFLTEWHALETTSRACWAPGMEVRSATGTAMARPCPQVGSPRRSSRLKRSAPAPWPYTTPSRSGRTASPSTGRCSSSGRTTWLGSTLRKSLSGHILFLCCRGDHTLTLCVQSV